MYVSAWALVTGLIALRLHAERGHGTSVADLAEATGLPLRAAYRLLRAMTAGGLPLEENTGAWPRRYYIPAEPLRDLLLLDRWRPTKGQSRGGGRGRPPDIGETRSIKCEVSLAPSELRRWRDEATRDGLTLSAWVRATIERARAGN